MAVTKGLLTLLLAANTRGFDNALGTSGKKLIGFRRTVATATKALSFFGGAFAIAAIVTNAAKTIARFDAAMVNLSAILRVSRGDMKNLEQQAIDLGGATIFTASEIGDLQTTLARFGFDRTEILQSTEDILNLAAAAGIDLVVASDAAASTLRAFGLEAHEMGRVVDVMANAFTGSALTVETFGEAMKFAAPLATAAGVSIEETAAVLGVLADNGIRGSIAGTSLRRILTELARDGKGLVDVFKDASKSTDFLVDALGAADDAVGKYALSAFVIGANNVDQIEKNIEAFKKVGTAAKIAEEQLSSLENQTKILSSAWEKFIVNIDNGEGIMARVYSDATRSAALFLEVLTKIGESLAFTAKLLMFQNPYETPDEVSTGFVDLKNIPKTIKDIEQLGAMYSTLFSISPEEGTAMAIKELNNNLENFGGGTAVDKLKLIIKRMAELADQAKVTNAAYNIDASDVAESAKLQNKLAVAFEKQQDKILGITRETVIELDEATGLYSTTEEITYGITEQEKKRLEVLKQITDEQDRIRKAYLKRLGISEETTAYKTNQGYVEVVSVVTEGMPEIIQFTDELEKLSDIDQDWTFPDKLIAAAETMMMIRAASEGVGMSLANGADSYENFAKSAVDSIFQVISALIMQKVIASTAAIPGLGGALIPIAIGAALGLAATAKNQLYSSFADGGIVSGPTLGLVGEYSGASRNPEVIAPLDKLKSMLGDVGGGTRVYGEFRLENRTLVAAIERETKRTGRYGS